MHAKTYSLPLQELGKERQKNMQIYMMWVDGMQKFNAEKKTPKHN